MSTRSIADCSAAAARQVSPPPPSRTRAGFPMGPAHARPAASAPPAWRAGAFHRLAAWTKTGMLAVAGGVAVATAAPSLRTATTEAGERLVAISHHTVDALEQGMAALPTLPNTLTLPALSDEEQALRAQVAAGQAAWREAIGEPVRPQRGTAFVDPSTRRLLNSPTGQRALALFGMPRGGIWIHTSQLNRIEGRYIWQRDRVFLNRAPTTTSDRVHSANTTLLLAHELSHGMAARGAGGHLARLYTDRRWRPAHPLLAGTQVGPDGRLTVPRARDETTAGWGRRQHEHLAEMTANAFLLAEERIRARTPEARRRWTRAKTQIERELSPGVGELYRMLLSHPVYVDHPDREEAITPPWDWRTVHDRGSADDRRVQQSAAQGHYEARRVAEAREAQATRARDGHPREQLAEWGASALDVVQMASRRLKGGHLSPADAKALAPTPPPHPPGASRAPTP